MQQSESVYALSAGCSDGGRAADMQAEGGGAHRRLAAAKIGASGRAVGTPRRAQISPHRGSGP